MRMPRTGSGRSPLIEYRFGQDPLDDERLEPFELFDEIRGKGRCGLDLNRREHLTCDVFAMSVEIVKNGWIAGIGVVPV